MESHLNTPLATVTPPFTFAVVGDTHFARVPAQREFVWKAPGTRPLDAGKYVENVDYSLVPMMESLREAEPAFVLLTGDLAEGQGSQVEPEELESAIRFFSRHELPLLFARGNHDPSPAYETSVLPRIGRVLGRDVSRSYYTFEIGGCRVAVLDSTTWGESDAQKNWFEDLLVSSASDDRRLFVVGHHPVWPVSRAFFSNLQFSSDLACLFARYPVDAYFCGHTHNQSMVLRRTPGYPVLQCMGAPIGLAEELPTPLDRIQARLVSEDDILWSWSGYLENTAPGWFLVHVDTDQVEVRWHHLNRGVESVVAWREAGAPHHLWEMAHPDDARLIYRDIPHLRRAYLRFSAWDAMRPGKCVRLNGEPVGDLPYGSQFAPRRMDLPDSALERLDLVNRIEIDAPGIEASTIGNLQIEAVLPGGRVVRTHPTGDIFTWSDRWDAWKVPRMRKVMPGRPIRTTLSFR